MCWKLKGGHKQDGDPAPDNLVEIETVGSNENLFDRSIFRAGGRVGADTKRLYSMQIYKFLKDEKYTISTNLDLTKYSYALNLLQDNISTSTVLKDDGWKSVQPLTFNYTVSDYYVGLIIKKQDNSEISLKEIEDVWFKIEEGSIATAYSSFEMGSVEIDVVNKNIFDNTLSAKVSNGSKLTSIESGVRTELTYTTTSGTLYSGIVLKNLREYAGSTIRMKADFKSSSVNTGQYYIGLCDENGNNRSAKAFTDTSGTEISFIVSELQENQEYLIATFYANTGQSTQKGEYIDYTNVIITIDDKDLSYVSHQSQTAIIPIQQEMLEGDYIADVEHHEWKKLVLTGDEEFEIATSSVGFNAFLNRKIISDNSLEDITVYCNNFKSATDMNWNAMEDNTILGGRGRQHQLLIRCDKCTTIEEWKAYLKQQYEAGNPTVMYYKLAEPLNLELTSEQKAVRETKLNTYKNITNINLSDELASIDVTYKKDLETIINNALATNVAE